MKTNTVIPFVVCLAFGLVCSAECLADKPNIILILADDLGWGDVSCNNLDTPLKTPALDSIANEGIRLTNAHTPSSVCTPTRYGLLTGRYPWRSYLQKEVLAYYCPALITEGKTTIASYLKSQGYRTAGFGKWHLGLGWTAVNGDPKNWRSHWATRELDVALQAQNGIDHTKPFKNSTVDVGFDTYFGTPSNCSRLPFFIQDNRVFGQPQLDKKGQLRDPACARDKVDDIFVSKAIDFIKKHEKHHSDQPFFVYLPLNAIHAAVTVPKRFASQSKMSAREDKILWTNESVAKMIAVLDEMNLKDDTLVIFTSDNGPNLSQLARKKGHLSAGPYRGAKTSVWDGGSRVPFLVRWPGHIPAGVTTDRLFCLTDVLASFAGLCGTPLPDGAGPDSFNMLPTLLHKQDEITGRAELVTASYRGFLTLRQGKWKAVFGTKWTGGYPHELVGGLPPAGTLPDDPAIGQLYDISVDPFEQEDLWKKRPEVVKSLLRELERIKQLDKPDEIRWQQGESPNRLIKETH